MGGGGGRPRVPKVEPESPAPTYRTEDEMRRAKEQARLLARRTGRESTILAGRMMTQRGSGYELSKVLGAV